MYWVKEYKTDDQGLVIEYIFAYFEIYGTVNVKERSASSITEFLDWYEKNKLI